MKEKLIFEKYVSSTNDRIKEIKLEKKKMVHLVYFQKNSLMEKEEREINGLALMVI